MKEQKIDLNRTWCTGDIKDLREQHERGETVPKRILKHVFYKSNPRIKAAGLNFAYTPEESRIHNESRSPIMFARMMHILNQQLIPLVLNDDQEEIVEAHFLRHFNIVALPRQYGMTTAMRCIALYESIMEGRSVTIISPHSASSMHNMKMLMLMIESMPYFLQSGIIRADSKQIQFENGGVIKCITLSVVVGYQHDTLEDLLSNQLLVLRTREGSRCFIGCSSGEEIPQLYSPIDSDSPYLTYFSTLPIVTEWEIAENE
jgi:hypothetical protein